MSNKKIIGEIKEYLALGQYESYESANRLLKQALAALDAHVNVPQSLKDTMEKITQRSLCEPMLVGMSEWNSMVRDVNLMLSGNKEE